MQLDNLSTCATSRQSLRVPISLTGGSARVEHARLGPGGAQSLQREWRWETQTSVHLSLLTTANFPALRSRQVLPDVPSSSRRAGGSCWCAPAGGVGSSWALPGLLLGSSSALPRLFYGSSPSQQLRWSRALPLPSRDIGNIGSLIGARDRVEKGERSPRESPES